MIQDTRQEPEYFSPWDWESHAKTNAPPADAQWEITWAYHSDDYDNFNGRQLPALLAEGWEPFAVFKNDFDDDMNDRDDKPSQEDCFWLKRLKHVDTAEPSV